MTAPPKPARATESGGPEHQVNVTYTHDYRYSLGGETWDRALYEHRRAGGGDWYWLKRADLPHVHARIVRRDGARRRLTTEYLMSAELHGDRVVVTDEQLTQGQWARMLGQNLSGDHQLEVAAETAIRDMAYRCAPEREATPRAQAHTSTGHLDIPVAECLPAGYLASAPQTTPTEARDIMTAIVGIVANRPKIALTMGASAGAPFVGPLHRQSHWWDLYGDARKGKSTTAALAASLWGNPRLGDGIVLGWNATSIGTGRQLGQLGILPPFFDERGLSKLDPAGWGELVYATCQGSSRLKAESDTAQGTHKGLPWFGVLFSTGNARLTDGISAGRFAGIPARVIELVAPFTGGYEEAEQLEAMAAEAYGWLGPAILEANNLTQVRAYLARAEQLVGVPEGGGVPGTIAKHLHMAVAGALMIDAQLGTDDLLTTAAVAAAREHLEANSQEPTHDADTMLRALSESLAARRSAWPSMADYSELAQPRQGLAEGFGGRDLPQHGYDQQISGIRSHDGQWLYVMPTAWRRLADELGVDSSVACARLYERGELHVSDARKKAGEWQASPRVLGRPTRVYQVALSALNRDDEDSARPAPAPPPPTQPEPTPVPTPAPMPPLSEPLPAPTPRAAAEPTVRRTAGSAGLRGAQEEALAAAKEALAEGRPLRFLAALEGPYAPRRRTEDGMRGPYWRPELPGITWSTHVINSWAWSRPYAGPTAALDRSGAFVAAASSVEVGHGALEHTGPLAEFEGRPGYYLVQVHAWPEQDVLPHPLAGAGKRTEVWVPAPTMALLRDLEREGRWASAEVLDSYTAEGVRLTQWAGFVNELRKFAVNEYGRGSEQYVEVKGAYGQALSLMLGAPGDHGVQRSWKCRAQRPDWTHAIQAQASATIWRWADDCRKVAPEHAPVELRNVDELVLPAEALEIVTTTKRPGGRAPLLIDPDGLKLGSFKVKHEGGE